MALTLEKLQSLDRVGLVKFFSDNEARFTKAAQDAYTYIKNGFAGQQVRQDDVTVSLKSVVEIDKDFRAYLHKNKLKQKYWIEDFTNLILDKTWDTIK